MNVVHLIGRLGKDPEMRSTQGGTAIANLTIATTERRKNGDQWEEYAEWHRVVMFGKRAEVIGQHMAKGSQIAITGSIHTRKWQDNSGQDRYTTEITAHDFEFVGGKSDGNGKRHESQQGAMPSGDDFSDDVPFAPNLAQCGYIV